MKTLRKSNGISAEYFNKLSPDDLVKMARDLINYGQYCYEVITDEEGNVVEVKHKPMIELTYEMA